MTVAHNFSVIIFTKLKSDDFGKKSAVFPHFHHTTNPVGQTKIIPFAKQHHIFPQFMIALALTALIGRIPVQGQTPDPYPINPTS